LLIQQIFNVFLFVTGAHYLYRQCMGREAAFFFETLIYQFTRHHFLSYYH